MPKLGIVLIVVLTLFLLYTLWKLRKHTNEHFTNPVDDDFNLVQTRQPIKIYTISDTLSALTQDFLQATGLSSTDIKFEKSQIPGWIKENTKCFNATEPKYLKVQEPSAQVDCGWFFIEDDTATMRQSFSILGTKQGPVLAQQLAKELPTGRWIWDLQAAQEAEDRKICKRLKICEIADLIPGKCGFCPSLNMGIPIKTDGTSLYTNKLACTGAAITNPFQCPQSSLCQPDAMTGKLDTQCLIKIAKAMGAEEQGAILHILLGDRKNLIDSNKLAEAAQQLLTHNKITTRKAFFGDGVCTRYDATQYYYALAKVLMNPLSVKKAVEAATFLLKGGPYEECKIEPGTKPPFSLYCVQQDALKNGFQRDGDLYPKTDADLAKFNDMTWSQVQDYFRTIPCDLQAADYNKKVKALKDVYGIVVQTQG